jgi:ADP-ribose pyrophosphatase YjhB (NUDIX family)
MGFIRVGAYVLLLEEGKLLLCRLVHPTPKGLLWTLPGGGLEFGEHPEAAAVREAREETGFKVGLGPLVAVESYVGPDVQHLCFVYRAQILGGELTVEAEGSTNEVRWVTPEEARDLPLVELAADGIRHAFSP